MKFLLIAFLALTCVEVVSQMYSKGSIAVAAICKNGIIIAADTRGGFWYGENGVVDFDKEPIAYYDTVQKIYTIKNFALCSVGPNTFGFKFINFYFKQYKKSLKTDESISINNFSFFPFMSTNYPHIIPDLLKVKMFRAGYQNNKPTLCVYQNGNFRCGWDTAIVYSANELNLDGKQFVNITCEEAVPKIEKIIRDYIKQYKKEYSMGGPIMFLKIAPGNKFEWLKNEPKKENFEDIRVFYNEFKKKKVKVHFTSPENKLKFEKWMESLQGQVQ
jgi:hypothetical protein